jgi:hypothetical protein
MLPPPGEIGRGQAKPSKGTKGGEMSRNKGPEPIRTLKHTEQCPHCKWWFTKRGIKLHKCLKAPQVREAIEGEVK